jgi:putative drug exporter of the RND superfamily
VTSTAIGGGRALVVDVPLAGDGADTASDNALLTLRNQLLPDTVGKIPGVSYPVAGDTASTYDIIHQEDASLPLVFGFVAVLAFVLLLAAFRSVTVPLASIALNLLSVGAAYGLVVLIFRDGRLQGPLGYTSFGGIIFWVPLMMFVFLFGISMDYHVFILSRVRELWARGSSPKQAIVGGIASSAGVVTSAALIMVALFSLFSTLPLIDLKILGVGTAAAVLIDATVIRGVLVPAALALLGDHALCDGGGAGDAVAAGAGQRGWQDAFPRQGEHVPPGHVVIRRGGGEQRGHEQQLGCLGQGAAGGEAVQQARPLRGGGGDHVGAAGVHGHGPRGGRVR